MIEYEAGKWQISLLFKIRGSVFPRSFFWAFFCSLAAVIIKYGVPDKDFSVSAVQLWAGYNFILGFLVVFRTQQAYSRFWEGATLLQEARSGWICATSNCIAFCSSDPEKHDKVERFQHLLVRLVSLLYCTALQQVAVLSDEAFEIIDLDGIDRDSLDYLATAPEKCLVVLQWIQKLINNNHRDGVIDVAAPLLTRVYQELSQGMVRVGHAQTITDIIFPFPYAQMVSLMLLTTTIVTPIICATIVKSYTYCAMLAFLPVFCFWSLNYIASEIEMPFGQDSNDLPVPQLQMGMNMGLRILLDDEAKLPPKFDFRPDHHREARGIPCPYDLITDQQHNLWATVAHKLERAQRANRKMRVTQTFSQNRTSSQRVRRSLHSLASHVSSFVTYGSAVSQKSGASNTAVNWKSRSLSGLGGKETDGEAGLSSVVSSVVGQSDGARNSQDVALISELPRGQLLPVLERIDHESLDTRPSDKEEPSLQMEQKTAISVRSCDNSALGRSFLRLEVHFKLIAHSLRIAANQTGLDNALNREGSGEANLERLLINIEDHCLNISKGVGEMASMLGLAKSNKQVHIDCLDDRIGVADWGETAALSNRPPLSL